jgi:hypothetical protein
MSDALNPAPSGADIDDALGDVIAELMVVIAALDSRSLDVDRSVASGMTRILDRQGERLRALRVALRRGDDHASPASQEG